MGRMSGGTRWRRTYKAVLTELRMWILEVAQARVRRKFREILGLLKRAIRPFQTTEHGNRGRPRREGKDVVKVLNRIKAHRGEQKVPLRHDGSGFSR